MIRVIVVWRVSKRGIQIGDLGGEKFVAGLQLLVFVQGQEIDLAEGIDGLAVFFQLRAEFLDRLGFERLEFGDDLGKVGVVLLLDILPEVFHLHRALPEGHLQLVSFLDQPVEGLFDVADIRLPLPEEGLLLRMGVPLSEEGRLQGLVVGIEPLQRLLLGSDLGGERLSLPFAGLRIPDFGFDFTGVVGEGGFQAGQGLQIGLPLFLQGGQPDFLLREGFLLLFQIGPERLPSLAGDGHLPVERRLAALQGLHLRLMLRGSLPRLGRLRPEIFPVENEDLETIST